jgi:hypothetical protein
MENMEVISTTDGYSLIVDEDEIVFYETDSPLVLDEIAKIIGLSKQMISRILRNAVEKVYFRMSKENKHLSSFEIISLMSEMFGVKTEFEYYRFFKLFPNEIKNKVRSELSEKGY